MSDSTVTPTDITPETAATPAVEPAVTVEPEPAVEPAADDAATVEPDAAAASEPIDDPAILRKEIEKLRRENAAARVKGNEKAEKAAKEAAEKAAAETQQGLVEKWGRELGLIKDNDEAPKPEDIIAQLTADRDAVAQRETETARRLRELTEHNALRDAAVANDGDFNSLSDSKELSKTLAALDHSAADYTAQVDAAVSAALQANPKFRKEQPRPAAGRSGADLSAGNGASKPLGDDSSIDELIKSRRERRGRGRK
ncbi:hypothetical protein [Rhodococcoides fascians]|uniref:hypothetical protein n=1 Tax=Rhodococcoides fascians TaxID=1828 RepID=UPI00055B9657|nr:hypothetical protein [Rhodococcus fascians]